ncbi:MAG: hypothetical protein AB1758_24205, partial [Candidatus Eremiobacterota bacterium]
RRSEGGLYYPLAVYLLFLMGSERPVFYLVAVLALVVSDTLAALVGGSYGQHPFQAEQDRKSLEGSGVFLLSTFLGVHLPLLLMTDLDRAACVLIGVQIALLVTCFEAISQRGNDNLIVPLGTYYLLLKLTDKPVDYLVFQLLLELGCLGLTLFLFRRFRLFSFAGALGVSLVLYGAISLGGVPWGWPPFLVLLGYVLLRTLFGPRDRHDEHQVLAVFYVSLVPTVLLLLDNTFSTLVPLGPAWEADPLYHPFAASAAAQLAMLVYLEMVPAERKPARSAWMACLASSALAWIWVVPISLKGNPLAGGPAEVTLVPMLAPFLFHAVRLRRGTLPEGVGLVRLQALAAALPATAASLWQLWELGLFL